MDDEPDERGRGYRAGALKGSLFVIPLMLSFAAVAYLLGALTS